MPSSLLLFTAAPTQSGPVNLVFGATTVVQIVAAQSEPFGVVDNTQAVNAFFAGQSEPSFVFDISDASVVMAAVQIDSAQVSDNMQLTFSAFAQQVDKTLFIDLQDGVAMGINGVQILPLVFGSLEGTRSIGSPRSSQTSGFRRFN